MKIGVLEHKSDPFIGDVLSRLDGYEVEFLALRESPLPPPADYRVIIDRASYRNTFLKEILKNLSLNGCYVVNNPFAASVTNKLVELRLCGLLGTNYPRSILLPSKTEDQDVDDMVGDPDWERISRELAFPCVLKPFDGFAWRDVFVANSIDHLRQLWESRRTDQVLMAQQLIRHKDYYRVFCINKKDVLFIKWIPKPAAMGRYLCCDPDVLAGVRETLTQQTIRLNSALDLDLNVVEWCIDEDGRAWVIDAFNDVPDIDKIGIPDEYYAWIVEKFGDCIKEKFQSAEKNKTIFQVAENPRLAVSSPSLSLG